MSSFSARIAPAEKADGRDQDTAKLDKQLAAVEPVDKVTFQAWSGKEAMKEKGGGSEVDAEVERLPQMAAQPETQVGSHDNESEKVKRYGANGVFKRWLGEWIG